nr:RHS repeat domain-containing protein [Pseudomonas syringae]
MAQVERFQDCSGKSTHYRYDERHQLIAVTDALNNTTTLERKPGGEVLRKPTDSGRKLGVTAEKLECSYDILCRLTQEASPRKLHPHSPKTPSVQPVHAFTSAIQFLRSMM